MFDILSITLPIFAIILVGYVVVRFGPLTSGHMRALGEFTMLVSLPCALFHAVATRSFGEVVNPSYLITLALAGLASQATIWTVVRFQNVGPMRRALGVLSAATPNTAFLGYPIFLLVIPEHAGPVVAMNLLIENLLLTPIGLLLIGRADRALVEMAVVHHVEFAVADEQAFAGGGLFQTVAFQQRVIGQIQHRQDASLPVAAAGQPKPVAIRVVMNVVDADVEDDAAQQRPIQRIKKKRTARRNPKRIAPAIPGQPVRPAERKQQRLIVAGLR